MFEVEDWTSDKNTDLLNQGLFGGIPQQPKKTHKKRKQHEKEDSVPLKKPKIQTKHESDVVVSTGEKFGRKAKSKAADVELDISKSPAENRRLKNKRRKEKQLQRRKELQIAKGVNGSNADVKVKKKQKSSLKNGKTINEKGSSLTGDNGKKEIPAKKKNIRNKYKHLAVNNTTGVEKVKTEIDGSHSDSMEDEENGAIKRESPVTPTAKSTERSKKNKHKSCNPGDINEEITSSRKILKDKNSENSKEIVTETKAQVDTKKNVKKKKNSKKNKYRPYNPVDSAVDLSHEMKEGDIKSDSNEETISKSEMSGEKTEAMSKKQRRKLSKNNKKNTEGFDSNSEKKTEEESNCKTKEIVKNKKVNKKNKFKQSNTEVSIKTKNTHENITMKSSPSKSKIQKGSKLPFSQDKLKDILNESATSGFQSDSSSEDEVTDVLSRDNPFLAVANDEAEAGIQSSNSTSSIKEVDRSSALKKKLTDQLSAARFRYINEHLYTHSGSEALQFFKQDKEAFQVYHQGFQSQVAKWPVNPVDRVIAYIQEKHGDCVVADFGCGDAKIARSLENKVHSFDLVAYNKYVTACDMARVPLKNSSVDVGVFCLSLMGTNVSDFLCEANRVIKKGGKLLIAEVQSRFERIGGFVSKLKKLGFSLTDKDMSNKMFAWFEFEKTASVKEEDIPLIKMNPCIYKRR